MLTIRESVTITADPVLPEGLSLADCLFFDIETTGLSPDTSSLYLISSLRYAAGDWTLSQWFADDYDSEPLLLAAFGEELSDVRAAVQYNGDTFDVPYLEAKWASHHLPYSFADVIHWDIYRKIRPYGFLFAAPNLKLKSMEEYLGIHRADPYDGGELISVYGNFLRAHYGSRPTEAYLAPLLLHNREDVLSLPALSALIAVPELLSGKCTVTGVQADPDALTITAKPAYPLPRPVRYRSSVFELAAEDDRVTLRVPFAQSERRYFFPDYKDYYYLPVEDRAVHKSVGEFVEKSYRRQATAATCYTCVEGRFLPADESLASPALPLFREEYKSKARCLLWDEKLAQDSAFQNAYTAWLLSLVTKKNRIG